MNTGILLFDGVQVTDFTGPYDVFNAARPPGSMPATSQSLFNVFTLGASPEVVCSGGLRVLPDYSLEDHPAIELLVVPGGAGTRREESNEALIGWIRAAAQAAALATTVCTGARLLAKTGLLEGERATTHWASIGYLRDTYPGIEVAEGVRYVESGKYVLSAGITAGIDMALYVVEKLHGHDVAEQAARLLEYDYWEGSGPSASRTATA